MRWFNRAFQSVEASMLSRITLRVVEAFLRCPYKAWLKLQGRCGQVWDYEVLDAEIKSSALSRLAAPEPSGPQLPNGLPLSSSILAEGHELIFRPVLETDTLSFRFDALKRAKGPSSLG